jgi:N utilization substance protein B
MSGAGRAHTAARSRARRLAVQALYQWQIGGQTPAAIESQFLLQDEFRDCDAEYFQVLLHGVCAEVAALDDAISPHLDRAIASVDPVERAVLRLGAYELLHRPELSYRVVINEAVEAAKLFGAEQGHRYVNGVLDKLARTARSVETGGA